MQNHVEKENSRKQAEPVSVFATGIEAAAGSERRHCAESWQFIHGRLEAGSDEGSNREGNACTGDGVTQLQAYDAAADDRTKIENNDSSIKKKISEAANAANPGGKANVATAQGQLTEQQRQTIEANRAKAIAIKAEATAYSAALFKSAFDCSDAEPPSESEELQAEAHAKVQGSDGEHASHEEGNQPKRMRLYQKTVPHDAPGYPARPLLKHSEYKVKKAKLKVAQLEQRRKFRDARKQALELISAQPELGDGDAKREGCTAHFELPHPSHRIVSLHGSISTIFCKACSGWSSRTKLKLLGSPCTGLKAGNHSQLRLLECGVLPLAGAKLPHRDRKPKGKRRKRCW